MFFSKLSPRELKAIEKIGTPRTCQCGARIMEEGEPGTSVCLIVKGEVEVRKNINNRQSQAVAGLGRGDMIGELGFLGVETRAATVVALTDCELLEFDRAALGRFLETHPRIGITVYRNLAEVLAHRLADTDALLRDGVVCALGDSAAGLPTVLARIRQNYSLRFQTRSPGASPE